MDLAWQRDSDESTTKQFLNGILTIKHHKCLINHVYGAIYIKVSNKQSGV